MKDKFLYEKKLAEKRGDITNLEAKALFNEIDKNWLVGVFYKQEGKLKSFVLVEGKTEEEAKKVADSVTKIINAN